MNIANVVIGSYVNGYSIVQELYEHDVGEIIVIDTQKDAAGYSNKISGYIGIENNAESLFSALKLLGKRYHLLILYPNKDRYLRYLATFYGQLKEFCRLAFNPKSLINHQKKITHYKFCEMLGVPFPDTIFLETRDDLRKMAPVEFPIVLKPDQKEKSLNALFIKTGEQFDAHRKLLGQHLNSGVRFLCSEYIPGSDDAIYAYVAYRTKKGDIVGEWSGRKLAQFPDGFGTFSSAANQAPEAICKWGRTLINEMDLWGINQAEFKYDDRDNTFKLMEINLRPMMWHRLGALCGMPLNYVQYLDAIDKEIKSFSQHTALEIHYIYLQYELLNILKGNSSLGTLRNIFLEGSELHFALWDHKDIKPFLSSFLSIARRIKQKIK